MVGKLAEEGWNGSGVVLETWGGVVGSASAGVVEGGLEEDSLARSPHSWADNCDDLPNRRCCQPTYHCRGYHRRSAPIDTIELQSVSERSSSGLKVGASYT